MKPITENKISEALKGRYQILSTACPLYLVFSGIESGQRRKAWEEQAAKLQQANKIEVCKDNCHQTDNSGNELLYRRLALTQMMNILTAMRTIGRLR